MKLKPGVTTAVLHPAIEHALNVADRVWHAVLGTHVVVTSLGDGSHSFNSFHYGSSVGDIRTCGADLRTRDLTYEDQQKVVRELRRLLGASFDVILERDHIHLEHDMRTYSGPPRGLTTDTTPVEA